MKTTFLAFLIVAAAAIIANGQYVPCFEQTGTTTGRSSTPTHWTVDGPKYSEVQVPIWAARTAETQTYKLNGGAAWQVPFFMPQPGRCVLAFESVDDRPDVAVVITDAMGRYIRKQPVGDIEIMILDPIQFNEFNRFKNYAARFSTGRQFSGNYAVDLPAGWYNLVINNRHSYLASKSVTVAFGGKLPTP